MSLSASSQCISQKRTLSSLLAGRAGKRPRQEDARRLQEAAVLLLHRHQNLPALLLEVGSPNPLNVLDQEKPGQREAPTEGPTPAIEGSFLVSELRRQAGELGVAVAVLSARMVLERMVELTGSRQEEEGEMGREKVLLNHTQRVQLSVLLQSTRALLSLGAFCSKLFWQQYWQDQKQARLEVVYHLHSLSIVSLEHVLESDGGAGSWLVSELKALCGEQAAQQEEEQVRRKVLSLVVGVLVRSGFQEEVQEEPPAVREISQVCCSVLDDLLSWVLDVSGSKGSSQSADPAADLWVQMFDASLCGVSVSPLSLRRFFTHSLTHTLTYRPRLKVSDAIAMQRDWSFAKSCRLLTSLFRKLAVVLGVEELLSHLQQVLETHEVNWQHVLSFLSTLLVVNPHAQPSLQELLSRLLRSAFEGYDLENLITAFLLARQGALEGPGLFPSYSDWFKLAFGRASGHHSNSKKSLVFLLKFLSDLVPFDPPQYLKVHILYPPYVAVKHRSLLQEYVSLARTRLADLKVSMEDMGLYEDVSGAAALVQPQCQARQDVEKAVSLFENTRKISATIMEASIFRRPYFLSRFLPALLTPRVLPVKADARMSFIEALRKAEKIPVAQYSSYLESCQRERQKQQEGGGVVWVQDDDDPQEFLKAQLQVFRDLVTQADDGEMSAQLARISNTLSAVFPHLPDSLIGQTVIKLHIDTPTSPELHVKVVNMLLRSFCQCLLDASKESSPTSQSLWASRFVSSLLGNTQLLTALLHRLWDLFHNLGPSLSAAHVLGLAVFVSHLHACQSQCPLVQLCPALLPSPVPVSEALSSALPCTTHSSMLFCVRLCVAAVSYGLCRGASQSDQQLYTPTCFCKKLLYLVPRLLPEARVSPLSEGSPGGGESGWAAGLDQEQWRNVSDTSAPWRKAAWTLWNNSSFQLTLQLPQCQLSFSEWLATELRVQRSVDALSDPDRQEYQQWACQQLYLSRPVDQGGCGGDVKTLGSLVFGAIMDQQTPPDQESSETGTCLPDLLSRLQEVVYEMELTGETQGSKCQRGHFLVDLLSQRCPLTPVPQPISSQLSQQQTLHAWNRVLLSLPAVLLVTVRTEGGRTVLDCQTLIEHVNLHQRKGCSPAGLLSYHLTAHLLKGVLSASVRCESPSREVNQAWSQISLHCPLLMVSTAHWWGRLSVMLVSLWGRLSGRESLPEQLQVQVDSHRWARSAEKGVSSAAPSAPPLLLAANLHSAWAGQGWDQNIQTSLETLGQGREPQQQVLVYLLFLTVTDVLTALLNHPELKCHQRALELCTHILSLLIHSSDWLLLFQTSGPDQGLYSSVAMVTSEEHSRLMPVAFYSLVLRLGPEEQVRTGRSAGFLHTAVLCYAALLALFLDGHTPQPIALLDTDQADLSLTLSGAQQLLLKTISLSSPTCLSSSQLSKLEALCSELDPEVAAALSTHLNSVSLSQEMDFL